MYMTLELKFLLYLNGKYFDFKKPHSDVMDFQLWVKVLISQGWVQAEIAVHTL